MRRSSPVHAVLRRSVKNWTGKITSSSGAEPGFSFGEDVGRVISIHVPLLGGSRRAPTRLPRLGSKELRDQQSFGDLISSP